MEQALLRACFHNALDVEEGENGLIPVRYTPAQRAFYAALPYGLIMGVKARMTAGITMEFETDAERATLCWRLEDGYPAKAVDRGSSLDVYIDGVLRAQHMVDAAAREAQRTEFALGQGKKRVVIWLPHTYCVSVSDLLLTAGASFAPVPPRARRALMIGDSITQGIGARFASTGYAMQCARALDCETVNQSISAVRFEPDSLENAGFTPDLISVALGSNDWAHRAGQAEFDDYAGRFFARIDALYPGVPVAVVSPVKRCRGEADLPEKRPAMYRESRLYAALARLCAPYPRMRCVNGWLLTPHVGTFFSDGLHPNDLGMSWYAAALTPILREMLA